MAFGLSRRPREERERAHPADARAGRAPAQGAQPPCTSSRAASASAWRSPARSRPEPELVLLDEPFSSLDATLRAGLRREVELILRDAEATALLVTHDQEEALSLADRAGRDARRPDRPGGRARRRCTARPPPLGGPVRGRGERAVGRGARRAASRPSSGVFDLRAPAERRGARGGAARAARAAGGRAAATPRWSRASSAATTCSTGCATRAGRRCWCSCPRCELHEVGDSVFVRPGAGRRDRARRLARRDHELELAAGRALERVHALDLD